MFLRFWPYVLINFVLINNVYCNRISQQDFILQPGYFHVFSLFRHVIVVGDLNVSHRRIDHCDPDEVDYFLFYSLCKTKVLSVLGIPSFLPFRTKKCRTKVTLATSRSKRGFLNSKMTYMSLFKHQQFKHSFL